MVLVAEMDAVTLFRGTVSIHHECCCLTVRLLSLSRLHFTSKSISQSHPEGTIALQDIDHPLIAFKKELADIKNNPLDVMTIS
jgi:hypothetical protein